MSDWNPTDDEIRSALIEAIGSWVICNLSPGELRAFYGMLRAKERAAYAKGQDQHA